MSMNIRAEIAKETVEIIKRGYYIMGERKIDFMDKQRYSEENSRFISDKRSRELLKRNVDKNYHTVFTTINQSTVKAVIDMHNRGLENIAVLNFASAVNPGGNFLTGVIAQEQALALSSGLYPTQLKHRKYYNTNRNHPSATYTHSAIYSPDIVFIRDENLNLLEEPITASILTLPAVNYFEAMANGEDSKAAKQIMRERMEVALALFSFYNADNIILGAFGAGVFGNSPKNVANWWEELLEERYSKEFNEVHFAVLDITSEKRDFKLFEKLSQKLGMHA